MGKTKNVKHPRACVMNVRANESATVNAVRFNVESSELQFMSVEGNQIDFTHTRTEIMTEPNAKKLDQVLASIPTATPKKLIANILDAAQQFNVMLAVDVTPDANCGDRCVAVIVRIIPMNDPDQIEPGCYVVGIFDLKGIKHNFEKIGWWLTVNLLLQDKIFSPNKKIALFTDHDLGNHDSFNTHEVEIFPHWKLPSEITLCYAKDKSPKDSTFQMAIKIADKFGHDYLKKFSNHKNIQYNTPMMGSPFTGIFPVHRHIPAKDIFIK